MENFRVYVAEYKILTKTVSRKNVCEIKRDKIKWQGDQL